MAASPKTSPDDLITLENTTESRWVFPFVENVADGPNTQVPKVVGRLDIGSACDKSDVPGMLRGLPRDPNRAPDPVVTLRRSEWEALGPVNHRVLAHLIASGQLKVHHHGAGA